MAAAVVCRAHVLCVVAALELWLLGCVRSSEKFLQKNSDMILTTRKNLDKMCVVLGNLDKISVVSYPPGCLRNVRLRD